MTLAAIAGLAMQISTPAATPSILQIYRDFVKPGSEAVYGQVEEDAARICAEFEFPHAYMGIEALTGPKEVWFFNGYSAEAEIQQLTEEYAKNAELVAGLEGIAKRKADLVDKPIETFAHYRPERTRGVPWTLSQGRFLVIVGPTRTPTEWQGTVFEARDGAVFVISAARTREEADALAKNAGPDARVFAVRPKWSKAAPEWVAADPEFWKPDE